MRSIDSASLLRLMKHEEENLALLDIRSMAEYNGWRLNGEKRGGHIEGAVAFPFSWFFDERGRTRVSSELKRLLASKGITPYKTVVIYGSSGEKPFEASEILKSLGYEDVLCLEGGFAAWSCDESLPVDRMKRFEKLVPPFWLNGLIKNGPPEDLPTQGYKIFEVSWGEPREYDKGHIPGAVHLDTNKFEKEPLWNKVSDQELEEVLLQNGITCDTTVILYESEITAAARVASIMMYVGVKDVRILDGGIGAWKAAGFPIETKPNFPDPAKSFGSKVPTNPEFLIDTREVKKALSDGRSVLVSVRSWAEYIGETSGYTYIKPKGRIKGALWGRGGSDAYHMEDYRNIDNTMRSFREIERNWKLWGITPDKRVIFSCGTGWRASEAFFVAYQIVGVGSLFLALYAKSHFIILQIAFLKHQK